jgi:ACS family glucarate transporter-like MFS transporter
VVGLWENLRFQARARKLPIFIGMALSMSMILCNYVQTDVQVVVFMALAFFGKGMGALGWAIISDVSPKRSAGMNGAIFNTFGSVAGIITPIVIGYRVQSMGSFNGALIYVALNAAGALIQEAAAFALPGARFLAV